MCTDIKKTIQNKLLVPIFKHEIQVFMACTLTGVSVKGASIRNVFRYQNVKYNLKGFLQPSLSSSSLQLPCTLYKHACPTIDGDWSKG